MMKADARVEVRVEMKVAAVGGALRGLTPWGKVGDEARGGLEVEQVQLARPLMRNYLQKIHELYEAFPHHELYMAMSQSEHHKLDRRADL